MPDDHHVLITGAGRGIGKALADHYRAAGHRVTATARDGSTGTRLEVTDPAQHHALAAGLAGQAVDLLICNAGVYPDKGQALEDGFPAQMWADTFAVNVTGVFLTVQSMLPLLRLSGDPKIAIISSDLGSQAKAGGTCYIYRASKAAVLNLGRNLAVDLREEGIAVGIYHPGWVRTDMGGDQAMIPVEDSVAGLMTRFAALSPACTGCFETWDGRSVAF